MLRNVKKSLCKANDSSVVQITPSVYLILILLAVVIEIYIFQSTTILGPMSFDLWPKQTVFSIRVCYVKLHICLFIFKVISAVSSSLNSSILQNNLLAEKLNDVLIQWFSVFGVHQIYLRHFSKMQVRVPPSDLSNLNLWDNGRKDISKFEKHH